LIAAGGRDGVKIGAGAGAIAGNEIADNIDHGTGGPSVLGGAWKQGEQATRGLMGQPAQPQSQPTAQAQPTVNEGMGSQQPQSQPPVQAPAQTPVQLQPQALRGEGDQPTAWNQPTVQGQSQPTAPTQQALQGSGGQPPVDTLGGAWKQGERATGDLFSGSPSGSNWGSLLGGGQPPTQIQSQSTEGSDSVKKDDTPPPSGR
jgi:hypothetical protein